MNEQDLKLQILDICKGDIENAKAIYAWLTEIPAAPVTPPEPAPTPTGIVLTDAEVMNNDDAALKVIAMLRLARKQNDPSSIKAEPETAKAVEDFVSP